ncbi:AAA family ATPase [Massilia varians]
MSTTITYTTWATRTTTSGVEKTADWLALTGKLRNPQEHSNKSECPLIKLAAFENASRAAGAQIKEVYGLEGDYDAGVVTLDEAAERLAAAGVCAFLYTSARHTPAKPRWRVLAPLSRAHTPDEFHEVLALLNGAVGGILAPESFDLSRCYFYGKVQGTPYDSRTVEGLCVDTLDMLITPVARPVSPLALGTDHTLGYDVNDLERQVALHRVTDQTIADLRAALASIPAEGDYNAWFRPVLALASLKETAFSGEAYELADEWSQRFGAAYDAEELTRKWISALPDRITYRSIFQWAADAGWTNYGSIAPGGEDIGALPDLLTELRQNIIQADDADLFDEFPHYVEKWIPEGEVTLLAGHGGTGKSYVALSMAMHVALGVPFGPLTTKQTNVLFFSGEDGSRLLRQRRARLCRALAVDPKHLDGKLHLVDASDMDPALHREQRIPANGRSTIATETAMLHALASLAQELDAGLIIIDNASDAYDDDEIKRARVRAFIRSLRSNLARPGRAVLLLSHVNKASAINGRSAGAEDYSGSTAWHNSARSRLSLSPAGTEALIIEHAKANLSGRATPLRLEWRDGVPVVVDDAVAAATRAASEAENNQTDKVALLKIIQEFEARGEHVTTATCGPLPTFRQLCNAKGFPKRITNASRLTSLLRELEDEQRVLRRQYKTPDRKYKECFTCLAPNHTESPLGAIKPAISEVTD